MTSHDIYVIFGHNAVDEKADPWPVCWCLTYDDAKSKWRALSKILYNYQNLLRESSCSTDLVKQSATDDALSELYGVDGTLKSTNKGYASNYYILKISDDNTMQSIVMSPGGW